MKSILKVLTTFSIFLKLVKWKVLLLIFSILSIHRNEKNMHYSQIFIKIRIFSSDEFPCKTEFSFFFWPVYPITSWSGIIKKNFGTKRISAEEEIEGKKKCRNYRMEVSRKIFLQGFSASNKKGGWKWVYKFSR